MLVTAGPTQEAIDPVRILTNHSTGKMGYAIARAAAWRGAEVTLLTGPTTIPTPLGTTVVGINSAQELFEATMELSSLQDAIFMTSAVADYRPAVVSDEKIKKQEGSFQLPMERTKDILSELGAKKPPRQFLCGFSMESSQLLERSRQKLLSKKADMIVANSIVQEGAGFGVDTNQVTLLLKDREIPLPQMEKDLLGHSILDAAVDWWKDGAQ